MTREEMIIGAKYYYNGPNDKYKDSHPGVFTFEAFEEDDPGFPARGLFSYNGKILNGYLGFDKMIEIEADEGPRLARLLDALIADSDLEAAVSGID